MARATWKGTISFGLVNIPVSLFPAEKRTDLSFRLMDSRNHARVRYERVNEVTGEEVPWDKIVKAYEFEDGNYVMLSDADFESASVEATQSVEIEDFTDFDAIDPRYYETPYILTPGKKGEKGYVLLREALKKSGKVGIARVVIRTRQYLAAVFPQDDAIFLCLLRFANELRKPEDYELPSGSLADYKISPKEMDLAQELIKSMTVKWKPEGYHDEYRDKLLEWIEKRAADDGHVVHEEHATPKPAGEIINIMDLLKRSMRDGGKSEAKQPPKPKAAPVKLRPAVAKAKAKAPAKVKAKPAAAKRRAS